MELAGCAFALRAFESLKRMERRNMVGGDNLLWADVRRAYEAVDLTVAEICGKFGVSVGKLKIRRLAEGWRTRPGGRRKKCSGGGSSKDRTSGCPSPRPSPRKGAGRGGRKVAVGVMATDRGQLVQRLFRAIETELTIIEERMADSENRSPQDSERDTRSIGALIKNLEKLTEFDGQQGGGDKSGAVGKITADEADRIRRDLATRIERLTKS